MRRTSIIIAAVTALVTMLVVSAIPLASDSSDAADKSFDVKYTLKNVEYNVHFDGPVDHVIVFGYAAALTVMDTDQIDKLYACDKYADDAYAEKGLERKSNLIANLSSSNVDLIFSSIMQAVQKGEFSKDDAVILTTMTSAADSVRSKLAAEGFTHVVFYGSMSEYSDIIRCVKEIEMMLGSGSNLYKNMEYILEKVNDALKDVPKKDAMFVWYSPSNGWGYGNTGSLSVSMINAAGGNNIGYTPDSSETIIYNKSGIIQKLGASPEAVIFLDSGYIRSYGGSVAQFVNDVLDGDQGKHVICVSEHAWNNYCPESAEGLWKMAHVLHPDVIEGDVPVYTDEGSKDNTALYIGIGVAAVIAVAGALVFLRMRY
ncbi:hypothetical protein [Methanomethylophilus alvi]|uniref:hypothetical protein n=1 Tax=Methanomethylophilus alvi TaxID=1291540 RepID=UPI0037DC5E10